MQPANLLHLTLSMGAGGIENLILNMARHLDNTRFTLSVGCLDSGGVLLEEIKSIGCDSFVLQRQAGLDYRLVLQLAKILHDRKIHILHTHNQAAHFYGCLAAFLARTSVVINTEHSRHYIDGYWRRRLEKRFLSMFTDKIVTVSEELRRQSLVRDKISNKKIITIVNGIDLKSYTKNVPCGQSKEGLALRLEFGIPRDNKVLGIIGRLHPIKNHALLFDVIHNILNKQQAPVSLLVVGDGELRQPLEDLSRSLGIINNVCFVGYRQDIPEILSLLDALVLCSHTEGLPLTLLEAMAAGVPVVVTASANKSGLVRHRINGLVADSTVASLTEMIDMALKINLVDTLVKKAKETVFQEYSINLTIKQYQHLYENIKKINQPGKSTSTAHI